MGRFVKGDVVVTPFPFSDLSSAKKRPALVIAALTGDAVILCQIASQAVADKYPISLRSSDFSSGRLPKESNLRPNRLFTADAHIILYHAGTLTSGKLTEVVGKIVETVSA